MLDPAALGWYERRPGSGVWYHPDRGGAYEPRTCGCGVDFMGFRQKGRGRFCSLACANARETDEPAYRTRHDWVRKARGPAADQVCADCGKQAREWSQIHGTDGTAPEDYEPRCSLCHATYDGHFGEGNGSAVLTAAQVREIYASVGVTHQELADIHGVDRGTVSLIRRGKTWRHITGAAAAE